MIGQGGSGICLKQRGSLREAGDAREKGYSVDEAGPHVAIPSCPLPHEWAVIRLMSRRCKAICYMQ